MRRITLSHLFMLCMAMMLVFACNTEEQPIPDIRATAAITIEEAQLWFDENADDASVTDYAHGRTAQFIKREPLWKWAESIQLRNGVMIISVPLLYEKGHGLGKGSLTKLIFCKDKQGRFKLQIMKIISNTDYFRKNSSVQSLDDFSGVLMLYDWQENFLSGVKYTRGKITGEVTPFSSANNGRVNGGCQRIILEYYSDVCIGSNCSEKRLDYTETLLVCSSGGVSGDGYDVHAGNAGEGVSHENRGGNPNSDNENTGGQNHGRQAIIRDGEGDIFIPGIDNPAIDLKAYLACFGVSQSSDYLYTITLYVNEPVPGSNSSSFALDGNVGHTCLGLTKTQANNPSNSITQVIGFYPENELKGLTSSIDPASSEMHDNGIDTKFTVSINFQVNPDQFHQAINAALGYASNEYDLTDYNCTNYAIDICNQTGIAIPQTTRKYPGQLGYDLRQLKLSNPASNVNIIGGYTAPSLGPC